MATYTFPSGVKTISIPAGKEIVRVHQLGKSALWYGPGAGQPPAYRFDAPAGEYGTLYCAEELTGAFVETVLRKARRIVGWPFVEVRGWTVLACKRELHLAKVFDEGLALHGVTNDICAGNGAVLQFNSLFTTHFRAVFMPFLERAGAKCPPNQLNNALTDGFA